MKEVFQQIKKDKLPPSSLKKDILNSLEILCLVGDVLELFTVRLMEANLSFLEQLNLADNDTEDDTAKEELKKY